MWFDTLCRALTHITDCSLFARVLHCSISDRYRKSIAFNTAAGRGHELDLGCAHRALAGLLMAVRGDHPNAILAYQHAVNLLGGAAGAAAQCNLCGLLSMSGRHDEAEAAARRFVLLAPEDSEAVECLEQVLEVARGNSAPKRTAAAHDVTETENAALAVDPAHTPSNSQATGGVQVGVVEATRPSSTFKTVENTAGLPQP